MLQIHDLAFVYVGMRTEKGSILRLSIWFPTRLSSSAAPFITTKPILLIHPIKYLTSTRHHEDARLLCAGCALLKHQCGTTVHDCTYLQHEELGPCGRWKSPPSISLRANDDTFPGSSPGSDGHFAILTEPYRPSTGCGAKDETFAISKMRIDSSTISWTVDLPLGYKISFFSRGFSVEETKSTAFTATCSAGGTSNSNSVCDRARIAHV